MIRLDMLGALALSAADGREVRPVLAQPKRLALLGYLAVESRRGFQRRDRLFALFWPELGQDHARQALRQALYFLRSALGEHVVINRGAEEIGIAPDSLCCDVCAFGQLVAESRLEEALSLYRGELLPGFFITDASVEFEQWLDATRQQLRQSAVEVAWTLSGDEERAGRQGSAVRWARQAAQLAPDDERSLQRLIALLDRQGDRAGALRAYSVFAQRLQAELDAEPSAETRALVAAVRLRARVSGPLPDDRGAWHLPPGAPQHEAQGGKRPSDAVPAPGAPQATGDVVAGIESPDGLVPARRARPRRRVYAPLAALAAALALVTIGETASHGRQPGVPAPGGWLRNVASAGTAAAERVLLRTPGRPGPVRGEALTSLAARRLYEQGLRAYYAHDTRAAVQLFHAALHEDSTFAMAAYYAGLGEADGHGLAARRDLALALHLSDHAPEAERMTIRQAWAFATNDPSQLAIAESLAARDPDTPEAEIALGRAMLWSGNFLGALPHLWRVIHADSLGLDGRTPGCVACDALALAIGAYISADSTDAAERVARDWTDMQPGAQTPWWFLASMLARQNRYASALAAERTAEGLSADPAGDVITRVNIAIGAGQFARADRLLLAAAQDANVARREDALWWYVISLRNQGRLRDALAAARRMVTLGADAPVGFTAPRSLDAVAVAQVLFETGRFHTAAVLFDSLARYTWRGPPGFAREAPGLVARQRIWMTTQAATALAAAHDTASLAAVVDSLTAWGPRSAYFRDRVLHHYARGLLLTARGEPAAAEREFRSALVSPVDGYNRVNLQLGRALLAEGRPRDAIPVLQAPLHGSLEASNYYLTQTALHAVLAQAFDQAGEPDSALAHYRTVLVAWRNADPEFAGRIAAIRRRVVVLGAGRSQSHPVTPGAREERR